jgi:hypothetical protein
LNWPREETLRFIPSAQIPRLTSDPKIRTAAIKLEGFLRNGRPAIFPEKIQDLAISFRDREELRSQYRLAYIPSNNRADGTFRKIRIDVANKNYKVKARTVITHRGGRLTSQK